ncbi:hypothetical protein BROUX41_001978 [Berkeleyomyces rouxiae]
MINVLLRSASGPRGISHCARRASNLSLGGRRLLLPHAQGTSLLARHVPGSTAEAWPARRFSLGAAFCDKSQTQPAEPPHAAPTAGPAAAKPAAVEVHEDIYTLPNMLTFSRLLAAPAIGYLILHDHHAWAAGLFAYAGITDMLDGWIARKWNQRTVVGTVIDPAADKALMTILTVCLAAKGGLPVWLAVIILGRDVGLAISAIYYRYISLPPPKTFKRYWDLSIPSAEVHPTTISKVNTALQLGLIGLATAAPIIPHDLAPALSYLQYIVATTTVWSGASYVYSKDAVKILNKV